MRLRVYTWFAHLPHPVDDAAAGRGAHPVLGEPLLPPVGSQDLARDQPPGEVHGDPLLHVVPPGQEAGG